MILLLLWIEHSISGTITLYFKYLVLLLQVIDS